MSSDLKKVNKLKKNSRRNNSGQEQKLVERLIKELPNYITVGMSLWQQGESILDWYKRVDQIHFNNNQ